MPKLITSHDVLEPLKQILSASRDVIISGQKFGSKLQRVVLRRLLRTQFYKICGREHSVSESTAPLCVSLAASAGLMHVQPHSGKTKEHKGSGDSLVGWGSSRQRGGGKKRPRQTNLFCWDTQCTYLCHCDLDGHPAMPVAISLHCHSW